MFLRCPLWLLLLPSINVSFLLLLNVLYSLLCMCAFSHSLFFLFRVSQLDLDLVLSQKMPAPTIPNSQQIAKKKIPRRRRYLSLILISLLSLILKRANARARRKRECAETLRTCETTIAEPTQIANESEERTPDEILTRYTFAWLLSLETLSHFAAKFLAFLSSLLHIQNAGWTTNILFLFPRNTRRQTATTTTTKERDTSGRARRLIDHVRRRRRCRNKKTRQLVGFLMVFLRSRTTINYDLFLINSNSLPVKYNHYNYVCV